MSVVIQSITQSLPAFLAQNNYAKIGVIVDENTKKHCYPLIKNLLTKHILIATGTMDTAETAGNAALDTYDECIKKGKTHADALSDARKAR